MPIIPEEMPGIVAAKNLLGSVKSCACKEHYGKGCGICRAFRELHKELEFQHEKAALAFAWNISQHVIELRTQKSYLIGFGNVTKEASNGHRN